LNTGDIGMSGVKGGIIVEISLSYLILSENRYLQDIKVFARPIVICYSQILKV
jgi:hypothetical protein